MGHSLLERLRQPGALRVEFQPIVHLTGKETRLYALEALTRGPRGTSLERADVLFEYARRKGQEQAVDLLCMAEALRTARDLPGEPHLSLNVHGSTLSAPSFATTFLSTADAQGITPRRLMLEIVEHRSVWPMEAFQGALAELRAAGVSIALDDLGVAASNYRMVLDCHPDHLKVDRYVVRGCSHDRYRFAVLESIVTLASHCDAVPIAEGVEETDDLALLRQLGIAHFQGWLWAPSMAAAELAVGPLLRSPYPLQ